MGRLHQSANGAARDFLDIPSLGAAGGGGGGGKFSSSTSGSGSTSSAASPPYHYVSSSLIPPLYLSTTTREESTRVQLQKQRLREEQLAKKQQQNVVVVTTQRIPGFKTSAAFFASLRTNLRLNASPPPSPWSTPPSMRASTPSLPPPSPLASIMDSTTEPSGGATPEDPMADVPELKTYIAEDEEDKISALRLVADSVAQMRQTANSSLIYHPLNLAILVAVVALVARYIYEVQGGDIGTTATTCTGLVMVLLVLSRWLTQPYIAAAEEINFEWLSTADAIVTKFGDEIIGTVIIDWISGESRQKRKKAQRGEIKGWAVRLKYRNKGVGSALLEEAVKESRKKGVDTIEFADEHANSLRVLPNLYNGKFDKGEKKARELLQDLLESSPARSKRKRNGST